MFLIQLLENDGISPPFNEIVGIKGLSERCVACYVLILCWIQNVRAQWILA